MKYRIEYYSDKVQKNLFTFPKTLIARFIHITERMKIHGPNIGMPHTKAMKNGLFEMRLKSQDGLGRVLYCTLVGHRIVILHGFVKKTDRTPKKDLTLGLARMKEVKKNALP